ncbi:hypothetical protein E1212_10250 [Jiangella ureilytica]|uniref:WD40 repeat domain-containing protein n=1 Tax=Jiangella ureilytica TaxID=2530374 RepID=A0A4R4RQZ3_9ACTN|nr:hypothetical protein [Jiangella ureilytica]TDC51984.1 hypothetical protein E1212_10250 [Jiangella ureilytica]
MIRRRSIAVLIAAVMALPGLSVPAAAATPADVWTAPGQSWAFFSEDGTVAVAVGNTSAGGRLEIRQSTTGSLTRVLTSPLKFTAAALSADNQTVAVTVNDTSSGLTVRTIRLYRTVTGALLRSIPTSAGRDLDSVHFAPGGQTVAAMDARSYERGGHVHVHRVSTGARLATLTVPATTAAVRFSPDGRFLAANDRVIVDGRAVAGVRVFRTDTWATALTIGDGNLLIRWTPDSTGIWTRRILPGVPTGVRLVSVPTGAVQRSLELDLYESVSDVTDDGALLLTHPVVAPRRSLTFTDSVTGADVATYEFGHDVFPGDISRDATLFSYARSTGPSAFTVHVARSSGP